MEGLSEKIKAVNAKKMATQTILSHSCSTPDEPEHDDCPSGRKSCDLTNGTNCHKPVKKPIPDAVVEVLQPLFDDIFLVGGQYCYTPKKMRQVFASCHMGHGFHRLTLPFVVGCCILTRVSMPLTLISWESYKVFYVI